MKNIIASGLLALGLMSASAADYNAVSLATTNSLTASATQTTGTGNVIDLKNYTRLGLQVEFTHASTTAAGNCTITLVRSADGVTYETTPTLTWVIANNSTNQVVAFTNLPAANTDAVRYIKIKSLQNGATNAMTGFKVWAIRKTITP